MGNLLGKDKILLQGDIRNVQLRGQHGRNVFLKARHDIPYDPVPLITNGLYLFIVSQATGSNLSTYDGHASSTTFIGYYKRYKDQSPEEHDYTLFFENINNPSENPTINDFGITENGKYSVRYFKFDNNKFMDNINVNNTLDFATTDPVTHIMWIRNVNINPDEYIYRNASSSPNQRYRISRGPNPNSDHLHVDVPVGMTGTIPRVYNYFTDSFLIDTSEWHMLVIRITAKSGAGEDIDIKVIGKNQVTWNWSDDPEYSANIKTQATFDKTYEFATAGSTNAWGLVTTHDDASSFESSLMLVYNRFLSDSEVNQVYQHFAPTHGLVAGIT